MSLNRYNPRRDANEVEIVRALQKIGCVVLRLSGAGVPDPAVFWPQTGWRLAEVKTVKGKLRESQKDWPVGVEIWRSVDDALRSLGVIRG